MIQGQTIPGRGVPGKPTQEKEALFSSCLGYTLGFVRRDEQYVAFDLNAGTGENGLAGCRGTPLVLFDQLRRRGLQGVIWLCDKSPRAIRALRQKFMPNGNLFGWSERIIIQPPVRMHNDTFALTIPGKIQELGLRDPKGIVVCDPNGLRVPAAELSRVLPLLPKVDVFIRLGGLLRQRSYWSKHPEGGLIRRLLRGTIISLDQVFAIEKRSWLISEPFGLGGQTTVLFGSNLRHLPPLVDKPGRPNLYRTDSPQGRELVSRLQGETKNGNP